jgi:glycosyltransferase involved in cell wall biosynthesis
MFFIYKPQKFNKDNPLILHIGTKSNKNLLRVIQALKNIKCHLIIVGKIDEKHKKEIAICNIKVSNMSNIKYQQIVQLYNQCDIVSFPSLYEGFGMPILEANKAGRPIVTSNICSMPEVAGDSACLVNPYDVKSIKNGFIKIIHDNDYREMLIQKGLKNIQKYSPEKIAQDYINIYEEIEK